MKEIICSILLLLMAFFCCTPLLSQNRIAKDADGKLWMQTDTNFILSLLMALMPLAVFGHSTTFSNGQPSFHYYSRDHLGNNRTVVSHGGSVEQVNHYYPFGAVYSDAGTNDALQRYKYNGKELDRMHGMNLYDYGARSYDPLLCRFTQTDPMAEKYYDVNPYQYCLNNPVKYLDRNGEEPTEEEAARIAAHVYGDKNDNILIGNWFPSERNFGITNRNGLKSQVYERRDDKGNPLEYVYATAGTDIGDIRDWIADITQVIGLSEQYNASASNAVNISNTLKSKELNYVGHSLGGGEAALNSLLTDGDGKGRKAFTFNAAGLSLATKIKEGGINMIYKSESNINAYITTTDPLNIIQNSTKLLPNVNGNRHYVYPRQVSGHSIENFIHY